MSEPLLEVRSLVVEFEGPGGKFRALDGVDLEIRPGESVGLVGESGCGKTTLARVILGLDRPSHGSVVFRSERGSEGLGMVWQDPSASLNPRWTIGRSVGEPARIHRKKIDVDALLTEVGLDPSLGCRYPHELSGGQRQRAAIARALSLRPDLLLCDEPTAALDLSIQSQILNLIREEQRRLGFSVLYISHDLPTVRFLCDRIVVLYLGKVVEEGPAEEVYAAPRHPYARMLLDSVPSLERVGELPIGGFGEAGSRPHRGCVFAPRCPWADDRCREVPPAPTREPHRVDCWHPLG
ncbi:MAG: ABC transporter ATP-binding protein [Fimbriimonadales bacterium]|nr:ABC transporter ATP-binding protein [Fimbriimonadales bacterium]